MLQKFTNRARRVLYHAQEEAKSCGQNQVAPEHLLSGLLREGDCLAVQVLVAQGVSLTDLQAALEEHRERRSSPPDMETCLAPRTRRVIDFAWSEARLNDHNFIATEHLLLGLIRERESLASRILAQFGVPLEASRDTVEDLLERVGQERAGKGSDSVRRLMHLVEHGQKYRLTGIAPGLLLAVSGVCASLALVLFYLVLWNGEDVVFPGALILLGVAIFLYQRIPHNREREAARQLADCDDVRAIGLLLRVSQWADRRLRAGAIKALTRLLPQMQSTDAYLLGETGRVQLYSQLNRTAARKRPLYVIAILKALEQVGDVEALPGVERLANLPLHNAAERQVREAAISCLPYLEVKSHLRRASRTLLRPAHVLPTPEKDLLHPANGNATESTELLRPETTSRI